MTKKPTPSLIVPPGPGQQTLEWFKERGIKILQPLPEETIATLAEEFERKPPEICESLKRKILFARNLPEDSPAHQGAFRDEHVKFKEFCLALGVSSRGYSTGDVWTTILNRLYRELGEP